jgi:hypothetical protein
MTDHATHDLELLAGAASGYEPDRVGAEELMGSCEECRLVYEEQLETRSLLLQSGLVRMTAAEERQLLSAVSSAFPAQLKQRRARQQSKALSPIWGRVMAAAAVLAVMVGIGATVATQQLAGGGATTTAAAAAAPAEMAAGGAEADERSTAASSSLLAYGLAADDDAARLKVEAESLAADNAAQAADEEVVCAEELSDLTIRARGESSYQGRPVLLVLTDGEPQARAFFADDCTEIALP